MRERSGRPSLLLESRETLSVCGESFWQNLDGNVSI